MSKTYAGNDNWPTPVTLADDGDAAAMTIVAASFESALDRTKWLRERLANGAGVVPLSSMPRVETSGTYTETVFNGVYHALNSNNTGATFQIAIPLIHGLTMSSLVAYFIPRTGRGGLPATKPSIKLARGSFVAGAVLGSESVISTDSYMPVSLIDYEDQKIKALECTVSGHVVDTDGYVYTLTISDESGANALAGNDYFALKVAYQ